MRPLTCSTANTLTSFPSAEYDYITAIETLFRGETMERQYRVDSFQIDLFMADYNLAIEIDEYDHKYRQEHDAAREKKIRKATGCTFVRCKTNGADAVFECCGEIFRHIKSVSLKSFQESSDI